MILSNINIKKRKIFLLHRNLLNANKPPKGPLTPASKKIILNLRLQYPRLKGKIRKRLKNGDLCFVKLEKKKIFHYTWVSLNQHYLFGAKMNLNSHQAYIHDVLTAPNFRRQGIAHEVLDGIIAYLWEKEVTDLFAGVYRDNLASFSLFRDLEFQPIGEIMVGKKLSIAQIKRKIAGSELKTSVLGYMGYTEKGKNIIEGILPDV